MWHAYAQYTYIWLLHYKFICWAARREGTNASQLIIGASLQATEIALIFKCIIYLTEIRHTCRASKDVPILVRIH